MLTYRSRPSAPTSESNVTITAPLARIFLRTGTGRVCVRGRGDHDLRSLRQEVLEDLHVPLHVVLGGAERHHVDAQLVARLLGALLRELEEMKPVNFGNVIQCLLAARRRAPASLLPPANSGRLATAASRSTVTRTLAFLIPSPLPVPTGIM